MTSKWAKPQTAFVVQMSQSSKKRAHVLTNSRAYHSGWTIQLKCLTRSGFLRSHIIIVIFFYIVLSHQSTFYHTGQPTPFAVATVVPESKDEGKENVKDASQNVADSLRDLAGALGDLSKVLLDILLFVAQVLWYPFHLLFIVVRFIGRLVLIILNPILRFVWWLCTPFHAIIMDIVRIVRSVMELGANLCLLLWALVMSTPPAVLGSIGIVFVLAIAFNMKHITGVMAPIVDSVWLNLMWALNLFKDVIDGLVEVLKLRIRRPTDVTEAEIEVRLASIWYHLRNARPPFAAANYERAAINASTANNSTTTTARSPEWYGSTEFFFPWPSPDSSIAPSVISEGATSDTITVNDTPTTNSEHVAECSICLTELNAPGNQVMALTRCGHVFHEDCIRRWLATSSSCPIDRIPAEEGS